MSIFDNIPMGEDGLKEVYRWLDEFVHANERIATKRVLGMSDQGREIPAVFVTNKDLSDDDKQVAVITAARHGQELGARVVGPKILAFLSSEEAREILDRQLVIVVPVANPDGFVLNEFCSSFTGLTITERRSLGGLFNSCPPDMIIDFHSLGAEMGSQYDIGDMEVIIPANTTRWAMDEHIHMLIAQKMQEAAEDGGWPYEIHTLEDLATYYFGGRDPGNMPWSYLKEKVYLLHTQDFNDNYDIPEESYTGQHGYTNYTCGPAYMKWHSLVFGMEVNHFAITEASKIAESGLVPCAALLKMGCTRFPWEKDVGYPVNILHGDFRISLRPTGKNTTERRRSRTRIWGERQNFNIPHRKISDADTTVAKVRYFGHDLPMEFVLCLRMRQKNIESVVLEGRKINFELFEDRCSKFIYIPLVMEKAGVLELIVRHPVS